MGHPDLDVAHSVLALLSTDSARGLFSSNSPRVFCPGYGLQLRNALVQAWALLLLARGARLAHKWLNARLCCSHSRSIYIAARIVYIDATFCAVAAQTVPDLLPASQPSSRRPPLAIQPQRVAPLRARWRAFSTLGLQ